MKPVALFSKNRSKADGRAAQCKACRARYRAENADKVRARMARYRAENADKVRAREARYRAEKSDKGLCQACSHPRSENDPRYCAIHRAAHRAWTRAYAWELKGYPLPTRVAPDTCECCGRKPRNSGARLRKRGSAAHVLSLDHCHATNAFRGWLCHKCNTALARLGDSYARAIESKQFKTAPHACQHLVDYLFRAKDLPPAPAATREQFLAFLRPDTHQSEKTT